MGVRSPKTHGARPVGVAHDLPGGLAHVAVLVLLAAAARAWVIAANAVAAVADRFRLLFGLLAMGDGGVLLGPHRLLARRRQGPRRRLVRRRPDHPQRFLKAFLLLHAGHGVRHLVLQTLPHGV